MRKTIIFKPMGVPYGPAFVARVERYLDGNLIDTTTTDAVFPTAKEAAAHAFAAVHGIIDSLALIYGDAYVFSVLHPTPGHVSAPRAHTLLRDALARVHGENLDGSPRRETIVVKPRARDTVAEAIEALVRPLPVFMVRQ